MIFYVFSCIVGHANLEAIRSDIPKHHVCLFVAVPLSQADKKSCHVVNQEETTETAVQNYTTELSLKTESKSKISTDDSAAKICYVRQTWDENSNIPADKNSRYEKFPRFVGLLYVIIMVLCHFTCCYMFASDTPNENTASPLTP